MTRIRLKYVHEFRDRHGKPRYYFRRPGRKQIPLPGLPGSDEFLQAYQAALAGEAPKGEIGASRTMPGTIGAVVAAYFASTAFLDVEEITRAKYRGIAERIRREHGDKPVTLIKRDHIEAMQARKFSTPVAANDWLRMMRVLMQFAVLKRMRADDPTAGIKPFKNTSQGFHTWDEDEIAIFEKVHPVGSKARLAMALMLYTGCRRGDVVLLGRHNIKHGYLTYTQQKNRKRKPIPLTIPVHQELRRIIDATPTVGMKTFLVTHFGKPFTIDGFSNWMRHRCDEAGLQQCSSHGLRKAIARRLAEAGMSPHQIMAITGHTTLKEVERYTRAASQKHLAEMAMRGIDESEPVALIEADQNGKPQ
jgi:integrase